MCVRVRARVRSKFACVFYFVTVCERAKARTLSGNCIWYGDILRAYKSPLRLAIATQVRKCTGIHCSTATRAAG